MTGGASVKDKGRFIGKITRRCYDVYLNTGEVD
jgi:hypothetical protein